MFHILAQVFWDDVCVVVDLYNDNKTSQKLKSEDSHRQIQFFVHFVVSVVVFLQRMQNLD